MKSKKLGKNTSKAEVLNVSPFGVWILVNGVEYFLDFKNYPWFQEATIKQISNLSLINGNHLIWKDLDVDLELESLENLEKYPLVYYS